MSSAHTNGQAPDWFDDWFRDRFGRDEGPYRPPEVWRTIECSKNAVYREIHNGGLRAIRVGGRFVIPRPALKDWLRDRYFVRK